MDIIKPYRGNQHRKYDRDHLESFSNGGYKRRERSTPDGYDRYKKRKTSSPPEYDDEERHYRVQLGESLTPRYKVLSIMGEGTFGKVVECWDREKKRYVAIKIIRAIEKYRDAAMIEIDVLSEINKHDPKYVKPCIQLLSWFDFRNHVCMVFEKYGLSLYDFLKRNHYQPFNIDITRDFAYQMLEAVAFLHDLTLIHTDLKPENILLKDSSYKLVPSPSDSAYKETRVPIRTDITIIDFGSATFDSHHHTTVVSTRHYRAPEVILGLGWSYPCDIWSLGCIFAELVVGDAIFQTHENLEHLALMEKIIGPIPSRMIEKAKSKYFRHGRLQWPEMSSGRSSVRHVENAQTLDYMIENRLLFDLISRMLIYEPSRRITAREALAHDFFKKK